MSLAEFRVGVPGPIGDGAVAEGRATRTREQLVSNAHGWMAEAVRRGNLWTVMTTPAGAAPGTALGTTAPLAIWNPVGNTKQFEMIDAVVNYLSGTLGAGQFYYVYHPPTSTPPGGTLLVPVNCLLGSSGQSSARVYQAATGLATPVAIRPLGYTGATTGLGTSNPTIQLPDLLDGRFVIVPGAGLSIQEVGGAGTTPLVIAALTWEEVPYP